MQLIHLETHWLGNFSFTLSERIDATDVLFVLGTRIVAQELGTRIDATDVLNVIFCPIACNARA